MKAQAKNTSHEQGFTILELLIATSVLAVILLLATTVIINIGNLYYKGFNEARIQDAVRDTVDQISQDVQLSGGVDVVDQGSTINLTAGPYNYTGPATVQSICMGDTRYSYVTGIQIGSGGPNSVFTKQQITHVLWRDTIANGLICNPLNLTQSNPETGAGANAGSNGQELVPALSRLSVFCVNNDGSCANTSGAYGIDVGMVYGSLDLSPGNVCTGSSGDQFCAADNLTASVEPRLNNN